jgi:hypothetical protein
VSVGELYAGVYYIDVIAVASSDRVDTNTTLRLTIQIDAQLPNWYERKVFYLFYLSCV